MKIELFLQNKEKNYLQKEDILLKYKEIKGEVKMKLNFANYVKNILIMLNIMNVYSMDGMQM